jgi:esterase/lipase
MTNRNLFLIHGAWCTKNSFNYIVKKTLDDCYVGRIKCFEYDCQKEEVDLILLRAKNELSRLSQNGLETVVVGHSLGGLFALKLSQRTGVRKTITLSSPLSGLNSINTFVHYYMSFTTPIFKHLSPTSKFISSLHKKDYSKVPVECLISVSGYNPMIPAASDGVVSIASQTNWTPKGATVKHVNANHSEILQSSEAILSIEKALIR